MRLSRSADFDRVFRHGRSHAGRELVLYVFPRGESEPPRLGLSVSRKVGGAVQRNKVKRLLREAFSLEGQRLPAGTDAVVVARHEANALAEREGLAGIRRVLSELVDRVADPEAATAHAGESDASASRESFMKAVRWLAVLPIRAYQRVLSPMLGNRCRYYPSCSEYAAQAIGRFGILRGLVLAGWRLLRCNPWSDGGFDPVEDQRLFKPRAPATSV